VTWGSSDSKGERAFILTFLVGGLLQFFFRQSLLPLLPLPLHIPTGVTYLGLLGTFGLFLEFCSAVALTVLLAKEIRATIPLAAVLLGGTAFSAIYPLYYATPWWYAFTVVIPLFAIVSSVEAHLKVKSWVSILLLPTFVLMGSVYYWSSALYLHLPAPQLNFVYLFLSSAISFAAYSTTWRASPNWRNLAATLGGVAGFSLFLPLYLSVTSNRFLEVIIDMVVPTAVGVTMPSGSLLGPLILGFGAAAYGVVSAAVKGDLGAAAGYTVFVTTVFTGLTGFHLVLFEIAPALGYVLAVRGSRSIGLHTLTSPANPRFKTYFLYLRKELGEILG